MLSGIKNDKRGNRVNKQALALAVGLTSLQPQWADALSLGELQVDSVLSQPLRASIPVYDLAPEALPALDVRVSSEDLFQRLGRERSLVLNNLRFDTVIRNGQPQLMIHTRYPFNEPFLDLLLEVSHGDSAVLHQYTLMPDLPQAQARTMSLRQHLVQRGDTLLKIAGRYRYAGSSNNQMMLALLQRNPQAFIQGDGNRLKLNTPLIIPSRQDVLAIPRREAQAFRAQLVNRLLRKRPLVLAEQPVAQPERSDEALTERSDTQQHLTALKQKASQVTAKLDTESSQTIERLSKQLEVKDLQIAELQMKLARINKTLSGRSTQATNPQEAYGSAVLKDGVFTAGETFKPALIEAPPSSAKHLIAMKKLPTATAGAPSPADADESREGVLPTTKVSLTPELRMNMVQSQATEVPSADGKVVPATVIAPAVTAPDMREKATVSSVMPPGASEEVIVDAKPAPLPVADKMLSDESPVSQVQDKPQMNEAEAVQTVQGIRELLGSTLSLYILASTSLMLGLLWLFAAHQRRKWRLVDDIVRELEDKRAEEGRSKIIWDKLVYAPSHWLIAKPDRAEGAEEPGDMHITSQVPAKLPVPEREVAASASTEGVTPEGTTVDADAEDTAEQQIYADIDWDNETVPPINAGNKPESTPEKAAVAQEVERVNTDTNTEINADDSKADLEQLRQQIAEMQAVLDSLQKHRDELVIRRDAA